MSDLFVIALVRFTVMHCVVCAFANVIYLFDLPGCFNCLPFIEGVGGDYVWPTLYHAKFSLTVQLPTF